MKKLTALAALFLFLTAFKHNGYHVDEIADDFSLKNINGKMVSLADYKDAKGFIVVFTCNHCPFSKKYEDRINALNKKYEKSGYPVIAINPNDASQHPEDDFQGMRVRAREKQFTFPYLHDETQEVARKYGATKTPDIFILKKEGKDLIVKYTGAIDDNSDSEKNVTEKYVENAVDALLAGKPIANTATKAVGCSIKWKK